MKTKSKSINARLPHISPMTFLLLWIVLGAGLAALTHSLFMGFMDWVVQIMGREFIRESLWRFVLLESLLLVSLRAPMEKILLRLAFGQWIRGWISASSLSTVISMMPYIVLQAFNLQYLAMNNFSNSPLIALTALVAALPQVWILRRYVQHSWLYIFAALLTAFVPVALLPFAMGASFGASFTIGTAALVMALMMLWFFRFAPPEEKAKHAESARHARLETPLSEDIEETLDDESASSQQQDRTLRSIYQALWQHRPKQLKALFTSPLEET